MDDNYDDEDNNGDYVYGDVNSYEDEDGGDDDGDDKYSWTYGGSS